jgi:hypothetical protein
MTESARMIVTEAYSEPSLVGEPPAATGMDEAADGGG